MALQISSHTYTPVAVSSPAPEAATSTPGAAHVPVTTPVQHRPDTVKLSLSGQIHQLKSQGVGANQIATTLGVDAKTVATYFPTATSAQTNAPAPAAQGADADGDSAKAAAKPSASAAAPTPAAAPSNQTVATK